MPGPMPADVTRVWLGNATNRWLAYGVADRAAAMRGAACATERSRHDRSEPWPGMARLGTPTSSPVAMTAAPPELPWATRAVVSNWNRGSSTWPSGSGTNVDTTPLVTLIESDPLTPGKPSTVTFWPARTPVTSPTLR